MGEIFFFFGKKNFCSKKNFGRKVFFVLKKYWKKLFRPKKNNFFENFWFFFVGDFFL